MTPHEPHPSTTPADGLLGRITELGASKIRAISQFAEGRADVLPFWFGESDQPTPDFIRKAAVQAIERGQTFYTHNFGTPVLRQAIAAYLHRLHGVAIQLPSVAVTSSGVSALMLAMQALLDRDDEVVVITPIWPNLFEIPRILGARVTFFSLEVQNGKWHLDTDRLIAALTPNVRLVLINSPSNPTGWQIEPAQQRRILEHCRRQGTWIISDEVYERLSFTPGRTSAPSFLSVAAPEDRVIIVNSFSKAWSMTGWRLGWVVAPPDVVLQIGKIIEYNTSCAPDFVQAAGVVALQDGEGAVAQARERLLKNRDLLIAGLRTFSDVEAPEPDGAMYAFFRVQDAADSVQLAKQLVSEVGLGLAPGAAFGPSGEGWLRWCFAASPERLTQGLARLGKFLT